MTEDDEITRLQMENERLKRLIRCLLEVDDPNEMVEEQFRTPYWRKINGGITILDAWRKDARKALEPRKETT